MKKQTLSVIGKPLRKIDAMAKCAGETIFADDLNLPRMIYAKLLRSPHPHARIHGINSARALKLDGVYAVITGEEMPQKFGIMPSTEDEEALAIDKVRYAGDPVAAVAAASESIAEKALGLIDVEYEVLKPILSIEEALACTEESERIHTWNRHANIQKAVSFEFGDVDGGFAGSDLVLEGTFFYQGNTHLPMSNTPRWPSTAPMTSSRCGLRRRRRIMSIGLSQKCSASRPAAYALSQLRWAAASAARAILFRTRSARPNSR